MRETIRGSADVCVTAMAMLTRFVPNVSLLSIFRSRARQALAFDRYRYRRVYLACGRRNRVRY